MKPEDRDRLVTLRKAKQKLITQQEASSELGVTVRQVQRLVKALKERGDKSVVHALRGKPSNRKIEECIERKAVRILSTPVYEGFGPTLAAEYLGNKHGIEASKETVRKWMMGAKLWQGEEGTSTSRAYLAIAAKPVGRDGAVGHQRARLAGRARRKDIPDRDD